ncbi:unnamed protein product [Cuscuta campestris]|uniref:Uncharacterized protein n=1 Tax=Cuscuta campestris TaxID=132261 RepID=A0A484N8C4_9ASTE|nr:unnamed protein product [Cuscuta campestris]
MRENPKLTNAFKASKDSSSEELSESSDNSSDSSSTEESNDEEDEEKAMRMKYTDLLKWKKYVKRKETYSKPKKERHKPRNPSFKNSPSMAPKKDTNKRTIAPGKILNLPDFPQFIISVLTLQGLLGFVAIDELVYDELVYEFYDNLSWETKVNEDEEETPFLKSRVKNKTINLGIEEICESFVIVDNRDGFETYDRHGWGIKGDNLASCIDKIHNGVEYSGIVRPKREFLNVNQQILLKILKECLLPTGSNDSIVGMLECAIVYLLEVESLVRFPMMMMNHMWIHKGYGQLPYGMALTKVFRRAKIKLEKYQGRNYE